MRNGLTDRHKQIVGLVELGLSNKQIARSLGIEDGTVKVHMRQIFIILGVSNRREIMLRSFNRGVAHEDTLGRTG